MNRVFQNKKVEKNVITIFLVCNVSILSYIFFYDISDKFEVIGSFIIVCSGLFLIYRENKLKIRPLVSKKSRTRDMLLRGH